MLEASSIFELKYKYGNLYYVTVKNVDLYFRELTFKEYEKVLYLQESNDYSYADIEDIILQEAIVHPVDFDLNKVPPGVVSSLAEEIIDISGFSSAKMARHVLMSKREQANEVKNLMKAFVLATISSYSPDDLEDMTFSQLAEKVALSEKIIEIQQGINGIESTNITLELIDPEEEIRKRMEAAEKHEKAKPTGAAGLNDPIAHKLWGLN
jgi:hypothetical protein